MEITLGWISKLCLLASCFMQLQSKTKLFCRYFTIFHNSSPTVRAFLFSTCNARVHLCGTVVCATFPFFLQKSENLGKEIHLIRGSEWDIIDIWVNFWIRYFCIRRIMMGGGDLFIVGKTLIRRLCVIFKACYANFLPVNKQVLFFCILLWKLTYVMDE